MQLRCVRRDLDRPASILVLHRILPAAMAPILEPASRPAEQGAALRGRFCLELIGCARLCIFLKCLVEIDRCLSRLLPLGIEHQRRGAARKVDFRVRRIGRAFSVRLRVPAHDSRAVLQCPPIRCIVVAGNDMHPLFIKGPVIAQQQNLRIGPHCDRVELRTVRLRYLLAG